MKKLSLLILTLMAGGGAQAADLPQRVNAPAPPATVYAPKVSAFDWNGGYAGVYGGFGWLGGGNHNQVSTVGSFGGLPTQYRYATGNGAVAYGLYGGYRKMLGSGFVAGVEGEFGVNHATSFINASSVLTGNTLSAVAKETTNGALTGTLGVVPTEYPVMVFLKAGLAGANIKQNMTASYGSASTITPGLAGSSSTSGFRIGGLLGAGVEGAISQDVTLRFEYLATAYEASATAANAVAVLNKSRFVEQKARFGLAYKF